MSWLPGLTRLLAVSILVALLAFFQSTIELTPPSLTKRFSPLFESFTSNPSINMTARTPVYFFSHGGPNVQYETKHPVYPVLQSIGKEITEKVKPKAVLVFSAHWQNEPGSIAVNKAVDTDLIYDFYGFPKSYYQATYPNKGSPQLAERVIELLSKAGIQAGGVKRGLDHGVWSGFNVAFAPESNPLGVPLVQVSLFDNEDPDAHYRLGRAVAPLREEGVLIVGAGMSVHNLYVLRSTFADPRPKPWCVSFDEALRDAVLSPPADRQARMRAVTQRLDTREAHPTLDHLLPVHVAAGAAGEDSAEQIWTMQEGGFGWAQYRFGSVPV